MVDIFNSCIQKLYYIINITYGKKQWTINLDFSTLIKEIVLLRTKGYRHFKLHKNTIGIKTKITQTIYVKIKPDSFK